MAHIPTFYYMSNTSLWFVSLKSLAYLIDREPGPPLRYSGDTEINILEYFRNNPRANVRTKLISFFS